MLTLQILVDGFAISSLYGLGAVGFTLIFGVSGVLNLSHGGIMVVAALIGWATATTYNLGTYTGAAIGVLAGLGNKWVDGIITRGVEVMFAFPVLLLALLFVAQVSNGDLICFAHLFIELREHLETSRRDVAEDLATIG